MEIFILLFLVLFLTTSFLLIRAVFVGKENISKLELSVIVSFGALLIGIFLYLSKDHIISYKPGLFEQIITENFKNYKRK